MRLATLNTELEMWSKDLSRSAIVPAGTTVQVVRVGDGWVAIHAPGGVRVTFPTNSGALANLDYLDEN